MSSTNARKLFLSHSHRDGAAATDFAARLEKALYDRGARAEVFCTSEPRDRFQGSDERDLRAYLGSCLDDCAAVLLLATGATLAREESVVFWELRTALERQECFAPDRPFVFLCSLVGKPELDRFSKGFFGLGDYRTVDLSSPAEFESLADQLAELFSGNDRAT